MNKKRIFSLIIAIAGITGLSLGFYYNHKLNKAASTESRLLSPFQDDTFGTLIGSGADKKIRSYRIKIHTLIILSALATAYGISSFVTKKKD
jgi:hypothetical protein